MWQSDDLQISFPKNMFWVIFTLKMLKFDSRQILYMGAEINCCLELIPKKTFLNHECLSSLITQKILLPLFWIFLKSYKSKKFLWIWWIFWPVSSLHGIILGFIYSPAQRNVTFILHWNFFDWLWRQKQKALDEPNILHCMKSNNLRAN